MASFTELSLRDRALLAASPWRRVDPPAWVPPLRLAGARVAIVSSAGFYRRDVDAPFRAIPGGDTSFRVIPADADVGALVLGQTSHSFDRRALVADPASGLPIPHLHTLAGTGIIGSVAAGHISFNGSILAPGRIVKQTGPRMADILSEDQVDLALFVPV